ILFLIIVGGILILFIYITRIASNEKFKTNLKISSITIIIPIIIFIIYPFSKTIIKNNETIPFNQSIELIESLNKYINIPLSITTVFIIIYLLLALIATVKITNFKQGSIRQ